MKHSNLSPTRSTRYFFVLILCFVFIHVCLGNKYSKTANSKYEKEEKFDPNNPEDNPFRMQKVNLLWRKGLKFLSGPKLTDLFADLKIHDRLEAQLKKLKAQDLDKDGAKEAQTLKSYRRIVDHYGLDESFGRGPSFRANEIPEEDDEEEKEIHFQDPKLRSMWSRAVQAGFSEKDLKMLKEEFLHQQMRVEEFRFLHRELGGVLDPDENSVDEEEVKPKLSPQEMKEKKLTMKKQNKEIKDGYMRLEHLASSLPSDAPFFKDSKVERLWAVAKKTNWTEEELESFKEELQHFETRLMKQAYFQEQLEQSENALKKRVEDREEFPEKHVFLQEKNKMINQRVKKLHIELKSKLDRALKHTEL